MPAWQYTIFVLEKSRWTDLCLDTHFYIYIVTPQAVFDKSLSDFIDFFKINNLMSSRKKGERLKVDGAKKTNHMLKIMYKKRAGSQDEIQEMNLKNGRSCKNET